MNEPTHAAPGTELPPLRLVPTLTDIVRYAGASGDFYPMHFDLEFARQLGHDELALHGLYKTALLGRLVDEWVGDAGRLVSLSVRHRRMDYRDAPLACRGRVESAGGGRAALHVWTENEDGEETTTGEAVVTLGPGSPVDPGTAHQGG